MQLNPLPLLPLLPPPPTAPSSFEALGGDQASGGPVSPRRSFQPSAVTMAAFPLPGGIPPPPTAG